MNVPFKVAFCELLMSIVLSVHPGVQLDTQADSKKSFCRSVTEGTWLHLTVLAYRTSLSGSGRDKQGLTPFGTRKTSRASGPIHYAPCGSVGA